MIFRKYAALRAFKQLCALNPHAAECAELLAAGVSPARITALYGSDFQALMPGIVACLDRVPDEHLLRITPWSDWVTKICERMPQALVTARAEESNWPTGKSSGHAELDAYLTERFKPYERARDALMAHNSAWNFGDALWHAHWFMARRAQLPWRARLRADKLMVQVGDAGRFGLPAA